MNAVIFRNWFQGADGLITAGGHHAPPHVQAAPHRQWALHATDRPGQF
jgi:hypothetical protein